jgi:FK506-binding protein 2
MGGLCVTGGLTLLLVSSAGALISSSSISTPRHRRRAGRSAGALPPSSAAAASSSRRTWLSWAAGAALLSPPKTAAALESDEYRLTIEEGSIGIELEDIEMYRQTGKRVRVKRLVPGGQAEMAGTVSVGDVLVSANGVSLETGDVKKAYGIIGGMPRPLTLTLRQPGKFRDMLLADKIADGATMSTAVAPALSETEGPQVVKVTRENIPKECTLGAAKGDLLEIAYTGRLAADGTLFDGSAVQVNGKDQVGRGGDTSVFFVLGNQPFGQFPPSWDVGLEGMCINEKRTLLVPPALGFGAKGLPRRRIPPNAELVYEVTLLSINGDAQPGRTVELPDRGVSGLGGAYDGGGR